MRTIETQIFTFDELSDEAKEKARHAYRQNNTDFSDFYADDCIDNAADVAELFGLDIRQTRKASGKYAPSVCYSGFWSQGDGLAFDGKYTYKKGALSAVKKEYPLDTKLHNIVLQLQKAQSKVFYRATADCSTSGFRDNNQRVTVDVENWPSNAETVEAEIIEALEDFAHWIYKRLESEYEYLDSDECINETLSHSATMYEFTADGEII